MNLLDFMLIFLLVSEHHTFLAIEETLEVTGVMLEMSRKEILGCFHMCTSVTYPVIYLLLQLCGRS